jgi:hypothetical protein
MEPLRCRDCGGKAAAVVQLDRTLPPLCFSCGRWRLAERTEDLVALLLPNGVVEGRYYRVGSVAGEPGRSLVINLAGPRRGRWRDFATGDRGDGGDPIDLIAATVPACGGDLSKAFAWGIGDFLRISASGRELERTPRRGDPKSRPLDPNLDAVRRIWREARPLRRGDPVDRYLSERGCSFSELGRAPKALRYHESLWHSRVRAEFPAMIAGIVDPAGNLVAIHRTYLAIEEGGRVVKAPVPSAADRRDAKMSLGPVRGNCVRLWHGNGPAAWDKAGPDEVVVVGAGLEDCIAAVLEKPRHRAGSSRARPYGRQVARGGPQGHVLARAGLCQGSRRRTAVETSADDDGGINGSRERQRGRAQHCRSSRLSSRDHAS